MTKKPRQFSLRSLMLVTLLVAILAAFVKYKLDYNRATRQWEQAQPYNVARRVIEREQAAISATMHKRLYPHLSGGWPLTAQCKELPADKQFLWNFDLLGTSTGAIAIDKGGLHNDRFFRQLAAELKKSGWELEIMSHPDLCSTSPPSSSTSPPTPTGSARSR